MTKICFTILGVLYLLGFGISIGQEGQPVKKQIHKLDWSDLIQFIILSILMIGIYFDI